jgi:hypothetical protein
MPRTTVRAVATIGIDMGKNTLHMIGLDSRGAIVLREKVSPGRIASRLTNLPPCLIGIASCLRVSMPAIFAEFHLARCSVRWKRKSMLMADKSTRPRKLGTSE